MTQYSTYIMLLLNDYYYSPPPKVEWSQRWRIVMWNPWSMSSFHWRTKSASGALRHPLFGRTKWDHGALFGVKRRSLCKSSHAQVSVYLFLCSFPFPFLFLFSSSPSFSVSFIFKTSSLVLVLVLVLVRVRVRVRVLVLLI